jgi:hypothetical protein
MAQNHTTTNLTVGMLKCGDNADRTHKIGVSDSELRDLRD